MVLGVGGAGLTAAFFVRLAIGFGAAAVCLAGLIFVVLAGCRDSALPIRLKIRNTDRPLPI